MSLPADRVKAAFMAAFDTDPTKRAAVLDEVCAGDPELRRRVEAMLNANEGTDLLLDQPAMHHLAADTADESDSPESPDEPPGTVIAGRYSLRQIIGEGGMGTVWIAEQIEPVRRTVAIKLIKPGMDSRQVVARFEAERQALAVMDHPHIARVLDGGTTESGRPYFVMDYVPGRPITEYCDAERVDVAGRLRLFVQVCEAVQHAHQKGIIHRDLKPSNVLVQKSDTGPVPKVIDFGLAKAMGDHLSETSLQTAPGMLLGTLQYMSPEQADLGNADIDTRADVYALGVILYELLTGTTPVDREQLQRGAWLEVLRMIREVEPLRPSARLNDSGALPSVASQRGLEPIRLTKLLRGDLDWIVMKALEKERVRRYESASGFAADVQRYLIGDSVLAVPPSAGYRLRKLVRRHRGPVVAGALVLVVLIGGVIGTTVAMLNARSAESRALEEEGKTAGERDQKEIARAAEQERRVEVEARYANQMIDLAFADIQRASMSEAPGIGDSFGIETPNSRRTMLGFAALLDRLPFSAREARDFVTMMVLYHGQTLHSLWPTAVAAEDLSVRLVPGTDLAVCEGADNVVRVRDLFTGREVRRIKPNGDLDMAWPSRDGRTLVVGHRTINRDRPVLLFEVTNGQPTGGFVEGTAWTSLWSPTGRHAVTEDQLFPPFSRGSNVLALSTRLLDGETGRTVASFPNYRQPINNQGFAPQSLSAPSTITFSPDGGLVLIFSIQGGTCQIVSTESGRVMARMPGKRGQFTPTSRHVVTQTDSEVLWFRCDTGQQIGAARKPGALPANNENEHDLVFGPPSYAFDKYVLLGRNIVCPDGRTIDLGSDAVAWNEERVLTEAGTVVEVESGRVLARPVDRRYHPDISRFTPDGRLLQVGHELLHLPTEKVLINAPSALMRIEINRGPRGVAITNFQNAGVSLLPGPNVDIDPSALKLWASVVAGGELDARGQFVAWDEPTWEARRRELEKVPPVDGFPFPGSIATDRFHWLRARTLDHTMPPQPGAAVDVTALLDRLVEAEPSRAALVARAHLRWTQSDASGSLDDWERVAKLIGPSRVYLSESNRWLPTSFGFAGSFVDAFLLNPGQTLETVQRFERIFAIGRHPLANVEHRLMLLYRLGRFREVVDIVGRREAAGLSGALLSPAMAVSPWVFLNQFLLNQSAPIAMPTELVVAAMAQHRLGRADLAQATLERIQPNITNSPLLYEAFQMTGHPKWMGKK